VHDRTVRLKQTRLADAVEDVVTAAGWLPAPIYAAALGLAARPSVLKMSAPLRSLQPLVANVVCTNVPGPQVPLYLQGRRLITHCPIVPLAFEFGLSFAVFSYDQRLFVGLIADGGCIDDLQPLTRHVEAAFADLREAAGVQAVAPVPIARVHSPRETPADAKA
jgi:hypothetical protein